MIFTAIHRKLPNAWVNTDCTELNGGSIAMCTGQCIGCITVCHHEQAIYDIQCGQCHSDGSADGASSTLCSVTARHFIKHLIACYWWCAAGWCSPGKLHCVVPRPHDNNTSGSTCDCYKWICPCEANYFPCSSFHLGHQEPQLSSQLNRLTP